MRWQLSCCFFFFVILILVGTQFLLKLVEARTAATTDDGFHFPWVRG